MNQHSRSSHDKSGPSSKRRRRCAVAVCGLTLLTATGCAGSRWASSDHPSDHVYSEASPQTLEYQATGKPVPAEAHYPDSAASTMRQPAVAPDGVVRLASTSPRPESRSEESRGHSVSTAAWDGSRQSEFQLTAFQPPALVDPNCPDGSTFVPAEPRLECDPNCPPSNRMELVGGAPLAELFPDEYLINGCDRDNKVAHHTAGRSGLDSQDTIGEFTDHTGEQRASASNCVAVYAPRFGSIRTVTGLAADTKVDRAAGANESQSVLNLKTGNAAVESVHDTVLSGLEARDRVDGMIASRPPMEARRTDAATQNRKIDKGLEGRNQQSTQSFDRRDGIAQQQQVLNAIAWTRDLYPVITASTVNASNLSAQFKAQQTVGLEDERQTKGALHIVKLADVETAEQGDVITFTIRFENTGDFDVYDIRIVDNLTPRLEYVQNSAAIDADHPGEVSVEPNGEGSSILTFTLDKPLKGHDRGQITFQAVVK